MRVLSHEKLLPQAAIAGVSLGMAEPSKAALRHSLASSQMQYQARVHFKENDIFYCIYNSVFLIL